VVSEEFATTTTETLHYGVFSCIAAHFMGGGVASLSSQYFLRTTKEQKQVQNCSRL
jgi:hypothetical protein